MTRSIDYKAALGDIAAYIEDEKRSLTTRPSIVKESGPVPPEKLEREVRILEELVVSNYLASGVGEPLKSMAGPAAWKILSERFLERCGRPSDPVEVILLEQLLLAHHSAGMLHVTANRAKTADQAGHYFAATARLVAELRRLALALKSYRERPTSTPATPAKRTRKARPADCAAHQDTDDIGAMKEVFDTKVGSNGTNGHANGHTNKVPKRPTNRRWSPESLEAGTPDRGGPSEAEGVGAEESALAALNGASHE